MTASFRSPRHRWPVLGLALAVGVSTVPASAAALQEGRSTLRIRVVEEGGGDPVPGAWARAWSETDRAGLASTNAHGRARWRGLDPGRWWLAVRCPAGRCWLSTRRLLEVELTGPGEYGHMGLALYRLDVSDVLESRLVEEERCSGTPHARAHHQVVFQPGEGRALLLGGSKRNGDWAPVARRPRAGRGEPGMCYDAGGDRVVLFGDWASSGGDFAGSTWEWNGEHLSRVARSGPVARAGHAFVYDPAWETCLLFGGRGDSGYLDDTWQWSDRGWRELDVEGPSARWFFGAATDVRDGRVIIFGGHGPTGDLGDTWAWDGEAWRRLAGTGSPPRSMAKMAGVGEGVLLFGGRSLDGGLRDWGDTWILVGARWRRLAE